LNQPSTVSQPQFLDALPVPLLFIALVLFALLVYECGFRLGAWHGRVRPDEKDGPTELLVGAILALMAFLLATTTALAADRFDARRALVVDEANAIGKSFLRAGYLPEPDSTEIRELLRRYAPFRINVLDPVAYEENLAESKLLRLDLWARAEAVARAGGNQPVVALFIESLNEAIDIAATREAALDNGRVPETVVWFLLLGAGLSAGIVGYNAGLKRRRGIVGALVLIVLLSAALAFVIDLDRPRDGLLRVSQVPLEILIEEMGSPQP
jgi:hypothetical protein